MEKNDILTVADLMAFEKRMQEYVLSVFENHQPNSNKTRYLKTREVKKLLSLSDNSIRELREKGILPYTFLGKSYYYPEHEILQLLEDNTINKPK